MISSLLESYAWIEQGATHNSTRFQLKNIEVSSIIFVMKTMPVPLVVPADLRSQVARIARKAKAKQAEVYRMALRCGLAEAEKRLVADSGRLFPNIDPLPRHVLDRWYRSKESKEWSAIEAAATDAQAMPQFEE